MSGKRQHDVDMMATKGDIVKDIIADTISNEIHHETGIACNKRENTEIRINIIKLEQLVKEYDLNNPEKEVPLYEDMGKRSANKKIKDVDKFITYRITKEELDKRRNAKVEYKKHEQAKRKPAKKNSR